MIYKNVNLKTTSLLLASSFLLIACGGESASETSSVTEPVIRSIPAEPVEISANSWGDLSLQDQTTSISHRDAPVLSASATEGSSYLTLRALGLGDLTNKYWQIHIDSDNNPATGYQFSNNAWSGSSGVDYIIENGNVYKSTTNNNIWSWTLVTEWPVYNAANAPEDGDLRFSLNAYDKGICGDINIGAIVLDHTWTIETFHPAASTLQKQTTTFCESNNPPVVTLNEGDITLLVGDQFIDPGATATDVEDGDLTSDIAVSYLKSSGLGLDTVAGIDTSAAGDYRIYYTATDSEGKESYVIRKVIVQSPQTTDITIDGKTDDWANVTNFSSTSSDASYTGQLKITDDADNIYIQVVSKNSESKAHWQIFIDFDNRSETGYLGQGGADYMIEDGRMSQFQGGSVQYQWSWASVDVGMKYAETVQELFISPYPGAPYQIMELAIPKQSWQSIGDQIRVSFNVRDSNWSYLNSLPSTEGRLQNHVLTGSLR